MDQYVKFDAKELEIVGFIDKGRGFMPPIPRYNTPITRRENFLRMLRGEHPLWLPHSSDIKYFFPLCVPDNIARGMVSSPEPISPDQFGGKDMFGIEWEYVPKVNGSMVRPGEPAVKDLDHWEDDIQFPDIETWDWEGCAKASAALLGEDRLVEISLFTAYFERLISMIEMTDALMAMIDEDSHPAIHRLFERLTDLYDKIFEKYEQYFHPDAVWFHDDWGNQLAPFFHPETLRETIAPHLKRLVDSAHKHGMFFDLHSCGKIEPLVPVMVECGVDMWNGQSMNDKLAMAKAYGEHIMVDSFTPDIPRDADEATVRAALQKYLDDYAGLRHYVAMNMGSHPKEYEILYELSRKQYNP